MTEAAAAETGTWRKFEFIRGADALVFIEAMLVWLGLIVLVLSVVLAAAAAANVSIPDPATLFAEGKQPVGFVHFFIASYYLVLLFFLWRIARRVSVPAIVARFRALPWLQFLGSILLGLVLAAGVIALNWYLLSHRFITYELTNSERMLLPSSTNQLPLVFLSIGLIGPFVEEFYFRGILLSWLSRKMPAVLAVLANGLLFGLLHFKFTSHQWPGGWYVTAVMALIGMAAAVLALRTKSLWAPFGLHASYNTAMILLPVVAVSLS